MEVVLAPTHPRPIQALSNLACCLAEQGHTEEALLLKSEKHLFNLYSCIVYGIYMYQSYCSQCIYIYYCILYDKPRFGGRDSSPPGLRELETTPRRAALLSLP